MGISGGAAALDPGLMVPFAGATAPNGWLLCYGQAVSRTVYAALFAAIGTVHGVGDGSTTFNLPDMRGRAVAGVDNMGGSAANRITAGGAGITGTTLGAVGGTETHTLTTAQLASHTHNLPADTVNATGALNDLSNGVSTAGRGGVSAAQGSGAAHQNTQPTAMHNYIIKT